MTQKLAHSERYTAALSWATQLHRFQTRKGKTCPYISHLIAVDGPGLGNAAAEKLSDRRPRLHGCHPRTRPDLRPARAPSGGGGPHRAPTSPTPAEGLSGDNKEAWLLRKTPHLASLERKPESSYG